MTEIPRWMDLDAILNSLLPSDALASVDRKAPFVKPSPGLHIAIQQHQVGDFFNVTLSNGSREMFRVFACRDCKIKYIEPLYRTQRRSLWNTHCAECADIQADAGGANVEQGTGG